MKRIIISLVSHNSEREIIKNFSNFPKKIDEFKIQIMLIDNLANNKLRSWAIDEDIDYYSDGIIRGYGENHNLNFQRKKYTSIDAFIVINPDVIVDKGNFYSILNYFINENVSLLGVKVYESEDLTLSSSHNRSFPSLLDPIVSFLFKIKLFENDINSFSNPDWIGGAFMCFNPFVYEKVNGFDNYFFMYYEDVDICRRIKKIGYKITYNPDYYIIHTAKREGRKLFSKSFFYNLRSMIKYFYRYPTFKIITKK